MQTHLSIIPSRSWHVVVLILVAFSNGCGGHDGPTDRDATRRDAPAQGSQTAVGAKADVNVLIVTPRADRFEPPLGLLTIDDVQAIASRCPSVAAIAPLNRARDTAVVDGRKWVPYPIFGTNQKYLLVRNWQDLKEGKNFTDADVRDAEPVCLVGQTIVMELFLDESPMNQRIAIGGIPIRVIGVLAKKGADYEFGFDQDDVILMPWTTVVRLFKAKATTEIGLERAWARTESQDKVPAAIREITQVLRERHHLAPKEQDDFIVVERKTGAAAPTGGAKTQ